MGHLASLPCEPCPHSGGSAPPWPASLRPSSAGCPAAPQSDELLKNKEVSKFPELPLALATAEPQPHLLLLSVGGSSSSMYSRFLCSSRSASCSFCLRAWEKWIVLGWHLCLPIHPSVRPFIPQFIHLWCGDITQGLVHARQVLCHRAIPQYLTEL